jgi:hypothetical protein
MTEHGKEHDSEQRLQRLLQGAFAGPPTPLKDVPKKSGELRAPKTKKKTNRRQNRKREASRVA